jgi:hypothetical protein
MKLKIPYPNQHEPDIFHYNFSDHQQSMFEAIQKVRDTCNQFHQCAFFYKILAPKILKPKPNQRKAV